MNLKVLIIKFHIENKEDKILIKNLIWGPTFEEMLNPEIIPSEIRKKALKARIETPLDPINLFNINWTDHNGGMCYMVIPKELTGVSANIIVMYSKNFPTGSHKVGATSVSYTHLTLP